jgi:prepilin-type N-terminal cleavage/methylation domain-containing protein
VLALLLENHTTMEVAFQAQVSCVELGSPQVESPSVTTLLCTTFGSPQAPSQGIPLRIASPERGFTLTELAVVLVIVALLIGGMLMPLAAQQDIRAHNETERVLNEIREALIGFAAANGRLPRPATSATNGVEAATCDDDPGTLDPPCSGFVPWATLGTAKLDGWGKLIRYSVTPAYANGAITLSSVANRTVRTRDAAGTVIDLASQVPAVIFSHGKNRWGTNDAGTALPDGTATNADEDANNAGPTIFFSRQPNDNTAYPGGEFDDIVIWLPTNILVNRMIAAGRLP